MDLSTRQKIILKADVVVGPRATESLSAPPCSCGCGQPVRFTKGAWSLFRPGHDARLVSRLLQLCRDDEIRIGDAVEFLNHEFTPALANKLLRFWQGGPTKLRTCKVSVPCGRPASKDDPHGNCDLHSTK